MKSSSKVKVALPVEVAGLVSIQACTFCTAIVPARVIALPALPPATGSWLVPGVALPLSFSCSPPTVEPSSVGPSSLPLGKPSSLPLGGASFFAFPSEFPPGFPLEFPSDCTGASLPIVGPSVRFGSPAKAGVAKAESAKQVAAANMNNRFLTSTTPKTVLYPVRIPDKFRRKMHVQM